MCVLWQSDCVQQPDLKCEEWSFSRLSLGPRFIADDVFRDQCRFRTSRLCCEAHYARRLAAMERKVASSGDGHE